MFFSFITPFYNVNKYLKEFLESFKHLDKSKYELILIDDRGKEDAYPIIKEFENILPIKIIKNKKNLGLGFSRNEGLKHLSSKTTNVIYIDSDDRINNDFSLDFIKDPLKITLFDFSYLLKHKNIRKNNYIGSGPLTRLELNGYIWGISIPKDIALKHLFETKIYEDGIVKFRIIDSNLDNVVYINKIFINYRIRRHSLSGVGVANLSIFYDFLHSNNQLLNENAFFGKKNQEWIKRQIWETFYSLKRKYRKQVDVSLLPYITRTKKIPAWLAIFMQKLSRYQKWRRGIYAFD